MKWTKEEERYLLRYYKDGIDIVSKVLGRTPQSCRAKYAALKKKKDIEDATREESWLESRAQKLLIGKKKNTIKGSIATDTLSPQPLGGKGNAFKHTRTGYRPDIDVTVRSGWEANVCRLFKVYGIEFEYEPRVFTYPVKRGNKSYKPDFYLPNTNEWVEVKGYLDANSKVKMKRFKRHYPEEWSRLTMIISGSDRKTNEFCEEFEVPNVLSYRELRKMFKDSIPNWEGK